MSEHSPIPPGGPELPAATPFDPAAGSLPAGLEWGSGRAEAAVLLVDAAADQAWAADAAVALAMAWARAGRRVVLADLHLEEPLVHERLGEPNLDGVVDVFLYGASLARTARPAPGRGFYLISSGTYTAEPEVVLRHPRWPRIAAGFRDAQATLLLFVPADAPGLESLARWAPTTVVLGEPDDALRDRLPAELNVRAVAAPAATRGPIGVPEPELPEAEVIPWTDPFQEREDPLLGEYADGIPASTLPAGAVKTREADLRDPPPVPPEGRRREEKAARRRSLRPLLLFLAGAVVVFAAAYLVDRANPEVFGRVLGKGGEAKGAARARPVTPKADSAPAPAAAPVPAGTALPYSVQAKAFASLRAARQMVASDSARLPGVPVYVSPELVDRVLYYKVLAGTLPDTVQAAQLRERMVQAGVVEAADAQESWSLVQFTPLAFDLGEFSDSAAARARADSLFRQQVPAYTVALPLSNGTERWRVYGGAFRDSVSAEGMRRILTDKKIEARLVQRAGAQAATRE